MQLVLAGLSFRPASAKEAFSRLTEGDNVRLIRDADNQYDSNAVQIHFDGEFIGFVAKEQAAIIAPHLDENADEEFFAECVALSPPRSAIFEFDV